MYTFATISKGGNLPLWWLDTSFGQLVFVLFFITWGLVIVALALSILYLLKKLLNKK